MLHIGLKVEETKVQSILRGNYTGGDIERAIELVSSAGGRDGADGDRLLILEQDSKDGIVLPIDYGVRLLGAVNRQKSESPWYLESFMLME